LADPLFLFYFILSAVFPLQSQDKLLSDPFIAQPEESSVHVVWFTEFPGEKSFVQYGEGLSYVTDAETKKLSRMREDTKDGKTVVRDIWRHEAVLEVSAKTPYRVTSVNPQNKEIKSGVFSCAPSRDVSKILLTSDHQLKPMVAANILKVKETVGKVDAVFFAGDLVNHPDKASEWFDAEGAFFPTLQGRASKKLAGKVYEGADLLQHAPIFPAIGNHEVMGRFRMDTSLNAQSNDPYPRFTEDKDSSFNTDSYEEIFTLPEGKKYYAATVGDVRLVVLDIARIWRTPDLDKKGKYSEAKGDLQDPNKWGYGEFIFNSVEKGSQQYQWLEKELQSEAFQKAKFKIVMFHHPMHSLGDNIVPPFTNPEQKITYDDQGQIASIRYEYPKEKDILINDLQPLLEKYGVQLVFFGHNHIWNRFQAPSGMQFLESSNVGNTNGGYLTLDRTTALESSQGNPNGLAPIMPTIAPLKDEKGNALPFIASNDITVYSVLDTNDGAIDSYYFDTTKPDSKPVRFDRFYLTTTKS
jgi:hypothetical protein